MKTPPGSCVSSGTAYSPPREFQVVVEKKLVEEAAPKRSWTGRISLLSNFSKILEKVVGNRLTSYLEQFGFRKERP